MTAYYVASWIGEELVVFPEEFGVRTNAHRYAERRGLQDSDYVVVTAAQKAAIESGAWDGKEEESDKPTGAKTNSVANNRKGVRRTKTG